MTPLVNDLTYHYITYGVYHIDLMVCITMQHTVMIERQYQAKAQRSSADRFQSLICDRYYPGTLLKQRPFSEDTPSSVWQSYQVQ